jgi:hypothetical protein
VTAARADGRAHTQLTRRGAELTLERVRKGLRTLDADVARLYHGGAAELLGYGAGAAGWKALCRDLFADLEMLRPTPAARLERVAELRRQEMSQRAIADTLGVSPAQVNADLRKLEERGEELPDNVVSLDGARRKARGERTAEDQPATALPADLDHLGLTELMRTALEHVAGQLDGGLSCAELELETGWGHGRASSLLYRLERRGLVARTGGFRGPHSVYVATWTVRCDGAAAPGGAAGGRVAGCVRPPGAAARAGAAGRCHGAGTPAADVATRGHAPTPPVEIPAVRTSRHLSCRRCSRSRARRRSRPAGTGSSGRASSGCVAVQLPEESGGRAYG